MSGDQKYLKDLRKRWSRELAVTILDARLNWKHIPSETVRHANNLQQSLQMHQQINDSVNADLGAMGIFGGGGSSFGFGGNADDLMFYGTMGLVRQHCGDPPATRALAAHASAILRGELDPLQTFALAGSHIPGYGNMLQMIAPMIGDMAPMLRQQAVIMAALALPRDEIYELLGIEPEPEPVVVLQPVRQKQIAEEPEPEEESHAEVFARILESAQGAIAEQDFGRAEEDLYSALKIAVVTPSPCDDIRAIDHMLLLAAKSSVTPDNLALCVQVLDSLNEHNSRLDDLARVALALMTMSQSHGTAKGLDPDLARIGTSLLGKSIPRKHRLPLTLATAGALHRTGDSDTAKELLRGARERYKAADDQLDVALLQADLYSDNGDREGAADLLVATLTEAQRAQPVKRMASVQKLVVLWPDDRPGMDPWLTELDQRTQELEEPLKTLVSVTTLLYLLRSGKNDLARQTADEIDLDEAEKRLPEQTRDIVAQIREGLARIDVGDRR